LKFLFHEKLDNKTEIHGLTPEEETLLELMITNNKDLLKDEANHETERDIPLFETYLRNIFF